MAPFDAMGTTPSPAVTRGYHTSSCVQNTAIFEFQHSSSIVNLAFVTPQVALRLPCARDNEYRSKIILLAIRVQPVLLLGVGMLSFQRLLLCLEVDYEKKGEVPQQLIYENNTLNCVDFLAG